MNHGMAERWYWAVSIRREADMNGDASSEHMSQAEVTPESGCVRRDGRAAGLLSRLSYAML